MRSAVFIPPCTMKSHTPYNWEAIFAREPHDALLEIAYRLSEGENLQRQLADEYRNTTPRQREEIDRHVARLHDHIGHQHDKYPSARQAALATRLRNFFDALMLRYIRPYDNRHAPYLLDASTPLTEQDLRIANRWQLVADQCYGTAPLYDPTGREYIYPGDESMLHNINLANSGTPERQFKLNIFPYPFAGNPLTAKIIILSENPGYVDHCNNTFARILQLIPQLAEGVVAHHRSTLRLDGESILPPPTLSYPNLTGSTCRDAGNILGEWYWHTRFTHFVEEEGIDRETIYSNVAIVQYVAYQSTIYGDIPHPLPSQHLTRQLIDYLSQSDSAQLFVIMRGRKLWEKFLGRQIYDRLQPRCIINDGRAQYFSEKCLGHKNYLRLLDTLKQL